MSTFNFHPDIFDAAEAELAPAPITWRWGRPGDMAALRLCHFQSEVAAGEPLYLPEQPSDLRVIAVAEKGGQIVGGLFAEDSVVVTMIGSEPSVAQSAYDAVIHTMLTVARSEGTRLVEIRLPTGEKFDLAGGAEA